MSCYKSNIDQKGQHDISKEDVIASFMINPCSLDHYITISIGYGEGASVGSLLLCCFHHFNPLLSRRKMNYVEIIA